jgi:hypothetical protein
MKFGKPLLALGISVALTGVSGGVAAVAKDADDDSVYRWGRWAVLAPAAGGEDLIAFAPAGGNDLGRCEAGANCPDPKAESEPEPDPTPDPVVKVPCAAGAACGFTRVDRRNADGSTGESTTGRFALKLEAGGAGGGTANFRANPDEPDEIASGDLPAAIDPTRFRSTDRDDPSLIAGRIVAGDSDVTEGFWRQIAADGSYALSGEFEAGIAATESEMAALMTQLDRGGAVVGVYEGPTANLRGATDVRLTMDFGAGEWTGQFTGAQVQFDAGGQIAGSGFVSDAGRFSDNIATGMVEGAFVNAGRNAIGAFEVTDTAGIRDADVFNAGLQ